MYMKNFIVVVKHMGKVLRERDGLVSLPFGAEYELLLKNKNSVKAVVSVEIDGEDVLDSNQLVIEPNTSIPLMGFMGGMNVKNRFKFIKKTKEIADYRGDRVDDGLIRVEFRFEKKYSQPVVTYYTHSGRSGGDFYKNNDWHVSGDSCYRFSSSKSYSKSGDLGNISCLYSNSSLPTNDEGITVKGSKTNQSFVYGSAGVLENCSDVIILRLSGLKTGGKVVRKPVTVKSRFTCSTCGRKSRSGSKFCYNCGTYLE